MKAGCRVKICGITNLEDRDLVAGAGADFFGVVVGVPYSPRSVAPEAAAALFEDTLIPGVALVFRPDLSQLRHLLESCRPQVVQFLSPAPRERLPELKKSFPGTGWWQSLHLPAAGAGAPRRNAGNIRTLIKDCAEAGVDAVVFDTAAAAGGRIRYGGTGLTTDWGLVRSLSENSPIPVFLAGGIRPSNVRAALESIRPDGIDLCSGVEERPGRKDPDKVREIIRLVRAWEEENQREESIYTGKEGR